jgi:DNA-binding NtrC family response regulator
MKRKPYRSKNFECFYFKKLKEFETRLINDALAVSKTITGAARLLELNRTTLVAKMKALEIKAREI